MKLLDDNDLNELQGPFHRLYIEGNRSTLLKTLTPVARGGMQGAGDKSHIALAMGDLRSLNGFNPVDGSTPMISALSSAKTLLVNFQDEQRIVDRKLIKARKAYGSRDKTIFKGKLSAAKLRTIDEGSTLAAIGLVDDESPWRDLDIGTFEALSARLSKVGFGEHELVREVEPKFAGTPLGDLGLEGVRTGLSRLLPGFFDGARKVANQVARVWVDVSPKPGAWGTAWMLTPSLLLTCWHVLALAETRKNLGSVSLERMGKLAECVCLRFDDEPPADGTKDPHVRGTQLVAAHWGEPQLDFAVLRVLDPMPERGKGLTLSRSRLQLTDHDPFIPANVPQYPRGGPLTIGVRMNEVIATNSNYVRYRTDTETGSSGSPVCDDQWRVWALHRQDGNQGTQIAAILDWLESNAPSVYEEIDANGTIV